MNVYLNDMIGNICSSNVSTDYIALNEGLMKVSC